MGGNFKIGKMDVPKPAAYMAGAAAIAILAYAYYKQRGSSGKTPVDTGTTTGTDPSIDPATGIPYADEFGSGGGSGYSGMGIYDPSTGGYFNGGYGNPAQTVTQVSTNGAWAQAAQLYLTNVAQMNPTTVSIALGKALTGQYVTSDQVGIFNAARAFEGEPPQPYPALNTHAPGGQPKPPPKTTGKGPVTGLKATAYRNSISLNWNSVSGARGYAMDLNGRRVATVVWSQGSIPGLKPHTHYTVGVTPLESDGKTFGTRKTVSVTTKK